MKRNRKTSDYKKERQMMACKICGYKAEMDAFLQIDPDDTICPKCGEKDSHTYNL